MDFRFKPSPGGTEEALKGSEETIRLILDAAEDVLSLHDLEGRVLYASPSLWRLTGFRLEELLGAEGIDLVHPDDRERVRQDLAALRQGAGPAEADWRCRTRDGAYRRVHTRAKVLADAEGRPGHVLCVTADVTERRRQEWQLREAQKLEAVGRLAGGVAHDFNNLLTVILGYAELLLEQAPPGTAPHAPLLEIRRAAELAAELTRQLLAFSRRQPAAPVALDLNALLQNLEAVLRRLAGDGVRLVLRPGPELRRFKADPAQLEEVLIQLVTNARDAMPAGGELTVATEDVTVPAGGPPGGPPPGEHVRLTVHDCGTGMDEATLGHVFEPFFTTKEGGGGLGLATVYGVVRQCGGHVAVASEPGRGTTFTLHFPAMPSPRAAAGPGDPARTVLLVEDEPAIRALVREVLEQQGHRVLEARDGLEALEVHGRHAGPVDLLLTDLVMPHLSGPELARRLLSQGAPLRLLFMSGYARDTALFTQPILGRRPHFLPKPFSLSGLLEAVREALADNGVPGAADCRE